MKVANTLDEVSEGIPLDLLERQRWLPLYAGPAPGYSLPKQLAGARIYSVRIPGNPHHRCLLLLTSARPPVLEQL